MQSRMTASTMHGNHRQNQPIKASPTTIPLSSLRTKQVSIRQNRQPEATPQTNSSIAGTRSHTPLNTRSPTLGRLPLQAAFPVRHAIRPRGR